VELRQIPSDQIDRVWSIDRAERIDNVYFVDHDQLRLRPEHHDMRGWPPGERELYAPMLGECVERGGACMGAFDADTLIGAAVLESRLIGRDRNRLQLKFLHVSHRSRGTGVGGVLFDWAVARARELGAAQLYISATSSENTVQFYLSRGCRLARELDAKLFALESKDIHMELDLPELVSSAV
jgi:GNAT superfamily N-acetyltransferase